MKIKISSSTKSGRWSIILMITNWIVFAVGSVLPWKPGYSGFEFVVQNPMQSIAVVLLLVAGIATVSMALNSIIKHKERSIMVFLAVLVGLYSILGFFGSIVNLFFILDR